jgi:hypothetical protein
MRNSNVISNGFEEKIYECLQRAFQEAGVTFVPRINYNAEDIIRFNPYNDNSLTNNKKGYYFLNKDSKTGHVYGFVGNWGVTGSDGIEVNTAKDLKNKGFKVDIETLLRLDREQKAKAEQQKERKEALANEARLKVVDAVNSYAKIGSNNPYLVSKGVSGDDKLLTDKNGNLIIPMFKLDDNGKPYWTSWQSIVSVKTSPSGSDYTHTKKFLYGGDISGAFTSIGSIAKSAQKVFMAEGYATAKSIYDATGVTTLVAFNAGNLEKVAISINKHYPSLKIVIVADNDESEVGYEKSIKAQKAVKNVEVVLVPIKDMDANDYAQNGHDLAGLLSENYKVSNGNNKVNYVDNKVSDGNNKGYANKDNLENTIVNDKKLVECQNEPITVTETKKKYSKKEMNLMRENVTTRQQAVEQMIYEDNINCATVNERFALTKKSGKSAIIDKVDGSVITTTALQDWLSNWPKVASSFKICEDKDTGEQYFRWSEIPSYKSWMDHDERSQYEGIEFNPTGKINPEYYNLYTGMPYENDIVENASKDDFPLINKHIKEIICNNDLPCYEYFMNWLAHLVQRVGQKINVAPVLKGKEGAGKGIICSELLGELIGKKYIIQATDPSHVIGKFNAGQESCLVLFCDEAVFDNAPARNKLKSMVTEKQMMLEQKGFDAKMAENYMNIIMASNHESVLSVDKDNRRYWFLNVSEAWCVSGGVSEENSKEKNDAIQAFHAQSRDYFNALRKEIYNKDVVRSFYSWLMKRDIECWDAKNRPQTKAIVSEIESGLDSIGKFLQYFIKGADNNGEMDDNIGGNEFYSKYTSYCDQMKIGMYGIKSNTHFGRFITDKLGLDKYRNNGVKYKLVSVEHLKAKFKEAYGVDIN